jgi:Asp-tRNA(Asn)/Glu-tRNA(Gln) amidotransferase A subunit family amidase
MDKIGPIARRVEDCALVFGVIHGFDGRDLTAVDRPFDWPIKEEVRTLRIGYVDNGKAIEERPELAALREIGVTLIPIHLPGEYPAWAMTMILTVESAAVFDPLVRSGDLSGLGKWPNSFLEGQFAPAVDYLRANRLRTLAMRAMENMFQESGIDAYVEGNDLSLTNLTGHPTVVVPDGFQTRGGAEVPTTTAFTGRLFGETRLLALAAAYEEIRGGSKHRPNLTAIGE